MNHFQTRQEAEAWLKEQGIAFVFDFFFVRDGAPVMVKEDVDLALAAAATTLERCLRARREMEKRVLALQERPFAIGDAIDLGDGRTGKVIALDRKHGFIDVEEKRDPAKHCINMLYAKRFEPK